MILAWSVVLGLVLAGIVYRHNLLSHIEGIRLHSAWLVFIGIILQIPLLTVKSTEVGKLFFQQVLYLFSYLVLLVFIWQNRFQVACWIVGSGLLLNLVVILVNSGWMPISPQTLVKINPGSDETNWQVGQHYLYSKDRILEKENTRLWVLSDIVEITIPHPRRAAYSFGDFMIASGIVFILLDFPSFRKSPEVLVKI